MAADVPSSAGYDTSASGGEPALPNRPGASSEKAERRSLAARRNKKLSLNRSDGHSLEQLGAWIGRNLEGSSVSAETTSPTTSPPSSRGAGICFDTSRSPVFCSKYDLGVVLGSGTMSTVRVGIRKSDSRKFAVKCVKSADEEVLLFTCKEFDILNRLPKHHSIISVEAMFQEYKAVYIVMQYCKEGSLECFLKKRGNGSMLCSTQGSVHFKLAKNFSQELLEGVSFMHAKRIVHRDLKPANLLISSSTFLTAEQTYCLKIADFNSAKIIGTASDSSAMLSHRGTPAYLPPEIRIGEQWNERCDIWAAGLCIYHIAKGIYPFTGCDDPLSRIAQTGLLPEMDWTNVSLLMKNLVEQCLTVIVANRPPADELLHHPFFQRQGLVFDDRRVQLRPREEESLSSTKSESSNLSTDNVRLSSETVGDRFGAKKEAKALAKHQSRSLDNLVGYISDLDGSSSDSESSGVGSEQLAFSAPGQALADHRASNVGGGTASASICGSEAAPSRAQCQPRLQQTALLSHDEALHELAMRRYDRMGRTSSSEAVSQRSAPPSTAGSTHSPKESLVGQLSPAKTFEEVALALIPTEKTTQSVKSNTVISL